MRGGPTGDLFCRVVVETPVNLSREQKELLRALEYMHAGRFAPHTRGEASWLDGVEAFFERASAE